MRALPEEVQPVPPQTRIWERNIKRPPFSALGAAGADGVLGHRGAVDDVLADNGGDHLRGDLHIGGLFLGDNFSFLMKYYYY